MQDASGPKRQLIDFLHRHLAADEQALLLVLLERGHARRTYGRDVRRRLSEFVLSFLDGETALRYREELERRRANGEPLLRRDV